MKLVTFLFKVLASHEARGPGRSVISKFSDFKLAGMKSTMMNLNYTGYKNSVLNNLQGIVVSILFTYLGLVTSVRVCNSNDFG